MQHSHSTTAQLLKALKAKPLTSDFTHLLVLKGINIDQFLSILGVVLTQIDPLFGHKPIPVQLNLLIYNRI
jgi:hypothetical protein